MTDPYTPVWSTLILMAFPIVLAYLVDYLYALWDKVFPKKQKYRE